MHRIDGAGHVDNKFVAEDPATLRPPTEITDSWMNAIQEEIAGFIEWAGGLLDKANNGQLTQYLLAKFCRAEQTDNVITGAGLVVDHNDQTLLRQAIAKMIQAGQHSVIFENVTFAGAVTGTGKAVYWDSANGRFDLALADGSAKQDCIGFADVPNACIYAFGKAPIFSGLTPGRYYLSAATAGAITPASPANAVYLGLAKSATEIFVDIDAVLSINKVIASVFSNVRSVVAASGDTTVMTLNFTLTAAAPIVVDWRAWFGTLVASQCYGSARLMLGATQKSRSGRIHLGISQSGYAYTFAFVGSTYLGVLAAGVYTLSIIWNNETTTAPASFNPGPGDTSTWSQADSEIIVRVAQ